MTIVKLALTMAWRENEDEVNHGNRKGRCKAQRERRTETSAPMTKPSTHQRLETNKSIHIKNNNDYGKKRINRPASDWIVYHSGRKP